MSLTVSSKSKSEAKTRTSRRRTTKKKNDVSDDDIRILAYDLYQRRSADGVDGDAAADWIEAERQLLKIK